MRLHKNIIKEKTIDKNSINIESENVNEIKMNIKSDNEEIITIIPNLKNNKCNFENCERNISILDMELKCKCGCVFCLRHRHFTNHNCKYDYKNGDKINLEKVIANKITKI